MLTGDYGLRAMRHLEDETSQARAELEGLEARRAALAAKVAGLRPDGLDCDLLEEQARDILGYVRRGELMIAGAGGTPPSRAEARAAPDRSDAGLHGPAHRSCRQ